MTQRLSLPRGCLLPKENAAGRATRSCCDTLCSQFLRDRPTHSPASSHPPQTASCMPEPPPEPLTQVLQGSNSVLPQTSLHLSKLFDVTYVDCEIPHGKLQASRLGFRAGFFFSHHSSHLKPPSWPWFRKLTNNAVTCDLRQSSSGKQSEWKSSLQLRKWGTRKNPSCVLGRLLSLRDLRVGGLPPLTFVQGL